MSIHLDSKYLNIVKYILNKNSLSGCVYAFGSRVRGDHNKYSDLDLVVKLNETLDPAQLAKVKAELEQSDLPITVDLIEWTKISQEFRNKIKEDLEFFN